MKELWQYLYPHLHPYKSKWIVTIILSVLLSALKGGEVWLVKYSVNSLNSSSVNGALLWSGLLLLFGIINFPIRFYHFYFARYLVDKINCSLRASAYLKMQNLPLSYFNKEKSGTLISQIFNDTKIFAEGLKSVVDNIREPLTAIIMLGMAVYTDWQLTLVIFLVAPLFVIIFVTSGKKVRRYQEKVQESLAHMTHNISEGVSGQKTLKSFNLQNYVLGRFHHSQDDFFREQMKTTKAEELAHPLVELVGTIAFSGVIIFAHYRIQKHGLTTGDFFRFVTALALLMDPLRKYGQANVRLNQARAAGKRILTLMKLEEEKDQGKLELKEFRDKIEIVNANFSYGHGEGQVLSNFSLIIPKGKQIALVGLSGSGKSTLINLLLRLYPLQPNHGKILIDGIPIENYTLKSVRNIFGLVNQETFLFHDTIEENLRVGRNISHAAIEEATIVANVREFVVALPQGLATIIGDRGTRLSGGQCQRLSIARAYLQNSPILLFDEATSALDNASEKLVQEALDKLSGQKTILAVAHRLSTIQNYDSIVVMRDGHKIEEGNHEQLMKLRGEYFKLYELGQND